MLDLYWIFVYSLILNLLAFLRSPFVSGAEEIGCIQNDTITTVEELISCFDSYTVTEAFYNEQTYALAQPTEAEEAAWKSLVSSLLNVNGNCTDITIPDALDGVYGVSPFRGEEFCVLHERKAENSVYVRGWGIMVVPSQPARPGVHLAAPHPQYDLLTPQQAAGLFEGIEAKSLLISGRIRTALMNSTSCIMGSGTIYYATDPAHNDKEPFVIASKEIWRWQQAQGGCPSASCAFIQMHGKGVSRSASSVAWYTDNIDRPIKRIQKNIRQANPSWNASLPSDSDCSLTATLNVFGRFINGVEESLVCEEGATAQLATGEFVHIEQAKGARQSDAYEGWIGAFNASFPVGSK
ncbi:hypothetical protein AAF712_008902 [Marasmius tenuissimus]|uniref:Ecp2 effector protein domain-containing protein n=1 Tax=Marasmius tenuissimus TaxID=585030 RepID=A0ABR2ZS84_9AGAR